MRFILSKSLVFLMLVVPLPAMADPLGTLVNTIVDKILPTDPEKPEQSPPVKSYRAIPEKSKAGILSPVMGNNQIKIDGDNHTLAFNARIRDEGNRIIHTGMIHQKKRIRYTVNRQKQVDRIWLLAAGEQ